MDKYTKFILTMIAVALFGINYHLFSGEIISSAEARHNTNNTAYGEGSMHVTIDNWPQ
jgi:lipopolysaccharide export system protein LptC